MSNFILAIDQGTTSSKAILFNENGQVIAQHQEEFKQYFPAEGWVEQDGEEIWSTTRSVCRKVLEHCADGALLMPAHFGTPFVCRVESRGSGFVPRFTR